jgi:hypothetical protein
MRLKSNWRTPRQEAEDNLEADAEARAELRASFAPEAATVPVLDLSQMPKLPVAEDEDSKMVSAPPSRSGGPGGERPRGKVNLTREERLRGCLGSVQQNTQ